MSCGILAAGGQAVIPKPCFGAIPGRLGALSRLQGLPEGCDRMNPVLVRGLAPPCAPRATRGAARSIPWRTAFFRPAHSLEGRSFLWAVWPPVGIQAVA